MTLDGLQSLAAQAQVYFPHCVIGGGAVRDTFLGGAVKDIDLFVDTRGMSDMLYAQLVEKLADKLNAVIETHREPSIGDLHATMHLHWVGPVIELLPVSRCVFTDIHDYDFGVSQAQVSAAGLVYTPAFQHDVREHVITYLKPCRHDASAKRLKRLRRKYPDRALVNCEVLL